MYFETVFGARVCPEDGQLEQAASASRLVLLCPWEVQEEHQGVCHLLKYVVFPKWVQSSITEHSSKGNWWRNLGWETFLMSPHTVFCSHLQAANTIEGAAKAAQEDARQALELVRAAVGGDTATSGSLRGLLGK